MKYTGKQYQGKYPGLVRTVNRKKLYGNRLVGCRQDLNRQIVEKILAEIAWNG